MFLLPVMLLVFSGGSAEVVNDFLNKCPQYFMNKIPPTVLRGVQYKQICQTLGNIQYYATLYDTNNKIPVYSAYKYTGRVKCERPASWYIEPQLEQHTAGVNMELKGRRDLNNQASSEDYKNSNYEKGHLAPVYHAASQKCADATFTLTNAAPQKSLFNKQWFRMVEEKMDKTLTNHCIQDTAHIVTGVVPGNNIIKNRVRVPSHFWTAYCCKDSITNKFISGGVIGVNSEEKQPPSPFSVRDLETELIKHYKVDSFLLFYNNCKNGYVPVIPDHLIRQSRKRPWKSRGNFEIGHPLF